jgi:hypothetical protein
LGEMILKINFHCVEGDIPDVELIGHELTIADCY